MADVNPRRRLPVGAEALAGGGVHFRVWAPRRRHVRVALHEGGEVALRPEAEGWFAGVVERAGAGVLYRFRLDAGQALYPDPASRFQPDGPHGPSQVVDPGSFRWTDHNWPGISREHQVIYEMHIGTFTAGGTYAAAATRLPDLVDLGITCVEMMPIAEFPGRFGWGYDGVDLFAPTRLYGSPDDLRAFIDRAHALRLAVILDVVYNHLGPDGNYLKEFSQDYFTERHRNEWGESLNFDASGNGPVRQFFIANAKYWIDEYHFDGYRFDATQAIIDSSPRHILADVAQAARAAAGQRSIYLVAENEPQHTELLRPPDEGGCGMDALWNDDFHHSAMVQISGRNEAYYRDYLGRPQEFVSTAKHGCLYQGQRSFWQKKQRGSPSLHLPACCFVNFIQNHDQIANSAFGLRAHQMTSPSQYRAMTALLLLVPQSPMLFQGQEFAASSPFLYFADHNPELAALVCKGRAQFMSQFPSVATPQTQACLPTPSDEATFRRCKLDWSERQAHAPIWAMHQDLLKLRRSEAALHQCGPGRIDGAVLGHEAFVLRFLDPASDDRLLQVNFGVDLHPAIFPEPLLAAPAGRRWRVQWSSEDPKYGGGGTPPVGDAEDWVLPGRAAVLMRPEKA